MNEKQYLVFNDIAYYDLERVLNSPPAMYEVFQVIPTTSNRFTVIFKSRS